MKKLLALLLLLPSLAFSQPTGGTSIQSPVDRGGTIGNTAVLSTGKVAVRRFAYTTNSAGDASTLNFASHSMQVGDWVYWRVGGEERQIVARTATSVTVSPPFSSAPGNSASIHWYRTALPKFVYESGVSNANGGYVGTGGMYDDGAGSITWTPFATNAIGYQYVNGQITSPLAIVSPNHNGVATDTMVGEKLISTHALTNSSTNSIFVLGSVLTEDVYAGDIAEIYVTATGKNLQRTKIGSYAASGSNQVTAQVADALYYTPDNTYSIRILRRQGLRTANSAPGSTDFGVVTRNIPSGTQDVNNAQIAGVAMSAGNGASGTGVQRVTIANDSTGVLASIGSITNALPAGANAIGKLAANSGVDIGDVDVTSIAAGSNLVGDVALQPRASSTGWDKVMSLDIDSATTTIKGSAGKLGGYYIYNAAAAVTYCKIYNLTSITPASDVPVMVLGIPPGSAANLADANGIGFSTGITVRCVSGVGNTNTGDPGTNAIVATFWYK